MNPKHEIHIRACLQSRIQGTKNHVLILKYKTVMQAKKDFKKLDRIYKLNDAALLQDKDQITLISPKSLTEQRLQKIIKASNTKNKTEFKRHTRIISQIDNTKMVGTLKTKNNNAVSKEHYNLLKKIGAKFKKPKSLVGSGVPTINMARIKTW